MKLKLFIPCVVLLIGILFYVLMDKDVVKVHEQAKYLICTPEQKTLVEQRVTACMTRSSITHCQNKGRDLIVLDVCDDD
jgi:hypothetical protein